MPPRGTLTLKLSAASIKALGDFGMLQHVEYQMRAAVASPRCFLQGVYCRIRAPVLELVTKLVPGPDLVQHGMLQDASTLNLEIARKAHGK
jgi:hypothetical protein